MEVSERCKGSPHLLIDETNRTLHFNNPSGEALPDSEVNGFERDRVVQIEQS